MVDDPQHRVTILSMIDVCPLHWDPSGSVRGVRHSALHTEFQAHETGTRYAALERGWTWLPIRSPEDQTCVCRALFIKFTQQVPQSDAFPKKLSKQTLMHSI